MQINKGRNDLQNIIVDTLKDSIVETTLSNFFFKKCYLF